MARYSKIDRRIWNDAKFRALSRSQPCAQVLFLYLLTNPFVGPIPGVYCAGEAMLAEALGWPLEGFQKAFREAFEQGLVKADFGARLIWIPKAIRYNEPESTNVVRSWRDAWDELPECELKRQAWQALRAVLAAKDSLSEKNESVWLNTFLQNCPEPSPEETVKGMAKAYMKPCLGPLANQEQEQEQEQDANTRAHPSDEQSDRSSRRKDDLATVAKVSLLASAIYHEYPRHIAKQAAFAAIAKAIKTVAARDFSGDGDRAAEWLKAKVIRYANSAQGKRLDRDLIPYPATWFNAAQYDDDESEWKYVSRLDRQRNQLDRQRNEKEEDAHGNGHRGPVTFAAQRERNLDASFAEAERLLRPGSA